MSMAQRLSINDSIALYKSDINLYQSNEMNESDLYDRKSVVYERHKASVIR